MKVLWRRKSSIQLLDPNDFYNLGRGNHDLMCHHCFVGDSLLHFFNQP